MKIGIRSGSLTGFGVALARVSGILLTEPVCSLYSGYINYNCLLSIWGLLNAIVYVKYLAECLAYKGLINVAIIITDIKKL